MNYEIFKMLVLENSHPPKKDCRWFRLSKLLQEYGEYKTAFDPRVMELELQDCYHTLALLSPFVTIEEYVKKEEFVRLDTAQILTIGLQGYNKCDQDILNFIYYYILQKVQVPYQEDILQSAYERLVCNSIFVREDNEEVNNSISNASLMIQAMGRK